MSAWRREALQRLPECRQVIEPADNPMALWIELQGNARMLTKQKMRI
jgi:hypothetical protein